jgi:cell division protein FtsB
VGGEIEGDPILQFEKDALYASYINALKELKERLEVLEQDNIAMKAEIELLKTK